MLNDLITKMRQENLGWVAIFLSGALALVYVIAFISSWVQIHSLVGSEGILPLGRYVDLLHQHYGPIGKLLYAPSIFYISHSDSFIIFVHIFGLLSCLALLVGILPRIAAALAWFCYLSISMAGQVFFHFQWDALLLEAGFLLIFLAPGQLKLKPQFFTSQLKGQVFIWLFRFLLFKLMFSSGIVKLLSGDSTYTSLTALTYHFFTQPLPNPVAWYAHQLPNFLLSMATFLMLVIELVVPFFIFLGRRFRLITFYCFLFLQLVIFLTGNYTFFNLLTAALCLCLLDDQWLRARKLLKEKLVTLNFQPLELKRQKVVLYGGVFLAVFSFWQLLITVGILPSKAYGRLLSGLMINNRYGLFATMTTQRPEIEIQGSHDATDWRSYHFHYKPGRLDSAPPIVAPHQPRLDWQMWFAALSDYRRNRWLINLMYQILEDKENAKIFFSTNPFQNGPPKYIRAALFSYEFARPDHRVNRGDWWRKEFRGYYTPVLSLRSAKPKQGKF